MKILALYGYGRRAVVKMDFAKIEEPHSKTKAKKSFTCRPRSDFGHSGGC